METIVHDVSSITISKTDMSNFGTVDVVVTTITGETLNLVCFHKKDKPIKLETGDDYCLKNIQTKKLKKF